MPYKVDSPPEKIKDMPAHAIEIWVAAFNAAIKQYDGDEGKANATAYAALKQKYEKKGDEWVAKEAKVPDVRQALQQKHAEIIQEYGRKNAYKDAERIRNIIKVCQELLDPLEEELDSEKTKKVEEAIKEADSVLALLKEQETVKTEDGQKFLAEAYAYAPDTDKPSDWKLRLWEDPQKKVTRKQLGAAAATLSPGGFRGQRVDIPREDLSSVKHKIRAAYRSLDVSDEEIPRWVKEAESRTILSDYIPLSEATFNGKGVASIVVIKPGFNSSKERYYSPDVLKRDFGLFEGVKMYADHPTEEDEKQRPERSIKDWVATLKNVHMDDKGQVIGEAVVVEPWLQAKLAELRDKGMLQDMGISINAVGTASKGEITGIKTNVVERINRVRSVDFVTEAGAGGMVTMYEVDRENDIDLVNLDTLRERRPDLVKSIETEVKAVMSQEVKKKVELEEQIKEKDTQIETLTKERDELKTKLTEAEKAKAKADAQAKIKEAVDKAELPDAAKVRLTEQFKEAEKADGIDEAIKAEADYIAKLADAGKVKGLGGSQPDSKKDRETLRESFKHMHPEWSEDQVNTAVAGR